MKKNIFNDRTIFIKKKAKNARHWIFSRHKSYYAFIISGWHTLSNSTPSFNSSENPNFPIPSHWVPKMINEIKHEEPWVNCNLASFAYRKHLQEMKAQKDSGSVAATTLSTRTGGRPKGSTNTKRHHLKEVVLAAKNEIVIPIVNYAWDRSFACVKSNLKAIKSRGWNPMNYNLLTSAQIQPTMTKSEKMELESMMKVQPAKSSADTLTQQSSSLAPNTSTINSTSMSDLTDDFEMNYDPTYTKRVPNTVTISSKLNFTTGRAVHITHTLPLESNILEAREENTKNARKGKEIKKKLENAKIS